jgi:5-methylcytosine-specific restriction endonuclease McrA
MGVDWFATATFQAYGRLVDDKLNFGEGGDCLRISTGDGGLLPLAFDSEEHLDRFLEAYKALCGYARPPLRITGRMDLARKCLYPFTLKRSDANDSGVLFRMRLDPLPAEEEGYPGGGAVMAGNRSDDPGNWKLLNKCLIGRVLGNRLQVASRPMDVVGKLTGSGDYFQCRASRSIGAKGKLTGNAPTSPTPKKRKRAVTLSLRARVLARDRHTCVKCGASPSARKGTILHVDHVIPFSRGGKCVFDNLQTLCEACNLGKGNRLEIELSES